MGVLYDSEYAEVEHFKKTKKNINGVPTQDPAPLPSRGIYKVSDEEYKSAIRKKIEHELNQLRSYEPPDPEIKELEDELMNIRLLKRYRGIE